MKPKQSTSNLTGIVTSCEPDRPRKMYRVGVVPKGAKTVVYGDSWYSLKVGDVVVIAGHRVD
jgi:hypothetical protein